MTDTESNWTCADAAELYGIDRWGIGHFSISRTGEVEVITGTGSSEHRTSLRQIVHGLEERGLEMPIMLRLENLIERRINELYQGFNNAIEASGYRNLYRGVFPIKVNQQGYVVEAVTHYGNQHDHGLEAGSKAELLIAMATLSNRESLIICNGYKDAEFIDLGLQARKLGLKCIFVIEMPKEVPIILERSAHWGVDPLLGIRLKLATSADGQWAADSGDRSLFGLTSTQITEVIDQLKAAEKLDCLQLLHFHLGSQIPHIRNIRDAVREACRYFVDVAAEGAALQYMDLGGGLGIDYDGTGSGHHSLNYTLDEYCIDVVETIRESLDPQGVPHPIIITESGRAVVAPMSVLLFNILDVVDFEPRFSDSAAGHHCEPIRALCEAKRNVDAKRLQESYNDAFYFRDQIQEAFLRGQISLRERALGENCYLATLQAIAALVPQVKYPSPELENLNDFLADIYYGNFSVFQSLPDAWAIAQVFPVMPIHRLDERPDRRAVIADLTCDCDGKLDRFVGAPAHTRTLPLHSLKDAETYYIGVFLVGAYQETLGDFHNLFGDTNTASVRIDGRGQLEFVHELEGDSVAEVLGYVEHQPQELYRRFLGFAERSVRASLISVKERQQMLKLFDESLQGYTYLKR